MYDTLSPPGGYRTHHCAMMGTAVTLDSGPGIATAECGVRGEASVRAGASTVAARDEASERDLFYT